MRNKIEAVMLGLGAVAAIVVATVVLSLPATWMMMLFLGNLGLGVSFVGSLPAGILVSTIAGGAIGWAAS